jgi:rhamnulokinase
MSGHSYLAFDLGASSGRGVLGTLNKGKISLKELNRFYNGMTTLLGKYHWDFLRLFDEIKRGITECAVMEQKPESIGLDTWGVDYALFDKQGSMLGVPYAYRDHRTDTAMEELFRIIPKERIYELTGIQFMQFNTIFQLYAAGRDKQPVLDLASDLLFVPDSRSLLLQPLHSFLILLREPGKKSCLMPLAFRWISCRKSWIPELSLENSQQMWPAKHRCRR